MRELCIIVIILQMAVLVYGSTISNDVTVKLEDPEPSYCFHQPLESCTNGCKYLTESNDTAVCCNFTSFEVKETIAILQGNKNLKRLHIMKSEVAELSVNRFWLPTLESIAFTDSQVIKVTKQKFTNLTNLKCLNLSNNQISEVDSRIVEDLPQLKHLDLSNNNLTNFAFKLPENGSTTLDSPFWLDISNNTNIWCSNITALRSWARYKWNLHFLNKNSTMCTVLRRGYWFEFLSVLTFQQLQVLEQVEEDCKKDTPCTCEVHRYLYTSKSEASPPSLFISVNCSGKNLTSLPNVPPHTIVLNISNNNITSLKKIRTDPNYQEIQELYADNNQIASLQEIEASNFLKHFLMLDIRANKITEIETYIYDNAFEVDNNKRVQLAGNKVTCDCNTAQYVKMWLLKNREHILDHSDIQCANFIDKVMDLDQNKVCAYPRVWTDYINYIIASEVALLLLLVSKVSYDYWVFRTAGYLPWPASKMPKMPCDWVFET